MCPGCCRHCFSWWFATTACPQRRTGAKRLLRPPAPAAPLGLRATFGELFRSRTAAWCYLGGALNLIVLSALYSWLPGYLGRAYGLSTAESGAKAARVILAGIVGAVAFGNLADRCGRTRPRRRLMVPAVAAVVTCGLLTAGMDSDRRAA